MIINDLFLIRKNIEKFIYWFRQEKIIIVATNIIKRERYLKERDVRTKRRRYKKWVKKRGGYSLS